MRNIFNHLNGSFLDNNDWSLYLYGDMSFFDDCFNIRNSFHNSLYLWYLSEEWFFNNIGYLDRHLFFDIDIIVNWSVDYLNWSFFNHNFLNDFNYFRRELSYCFYCDYLINKLRYGYYDFFCYINFNYFLDFLFNYFWSVDDNGIILFNNLINSFFD